MTRHSTTMSRAFFETLYDQDPDPWKFTSSAYERDKYRATLAALPKAHYASALELGCSIGVFTKLLSERCSKVTAIDGSEIAVRFARLACRGLANIYFLQMMVPESFPKGSFDLIVLSEILYFLTADDVRLLADLCLAALPPQGDVVLAHWLGETNYPLSGDDASEIFIAATRKRARAEQGFRHKAYRLDVLRAGPRGGGVA